MFGLEQSKVYFGTRMKPIAQWNQNCRLLNFDCNGFIFTDWAPFNALYSSFIDRKTYFMHLNIINMELTSISVVTNKWGLFIEFFRKDYLSTVQTFQYEDTNDVFEREPYSVLFESPMTGEQN